MKKRMTLSILLLLLLQGAVFGLDIRVTPNPIRTSADMTFTVVSTVPGGATITYKIFDMNRRLVTTLSGDASTAKSWVYADRIKCNSGIYIVHAKLSNGEETKLRVGHIRP